MQCLTLKKWSRLFCMIKYEVNTKGKNEDFQKSANVNESRREKTNNLLFPNRSDTNRAVQVQKMARGWKFWI